MLTYMRAMFSIAFSLFIVMNAIGSMPLYISFLKGISHRRQKQIVLREMLIALGVIIFFNFVGKLLLNLLHVDQASLQISGGVVLFLISIKLLIPPEHEKEVSKSEIKEIKEPFIVPLAIPLLAGPAVLATVMLYGQQVTNDLLMISAIVISWFVSLIILLASTHLSKYLGDRGTMACERLMGFIMVLIAVQMFMRGLTAFLKA